jgi:hypothetical protein
MFGEGISTFELFHLIKAIREKELVVQVKILDGLWEDFSSAKLQEILRVVTTGQVTNSSDIRLRLFAKSATPKPTVPPP